MILSFLIVLTTTISITITIIMLYTSMSLFSTKQHQESTYNPMSTQLQPQEIQKKTIDQNLHRKQNMIKTEHGTLTFRMITKTLISKHQILTRCKTLCPFYPNLKQS